MISSAKLDKKLTRKSYIVIDLLTNKFVCITSRKYIANKRVAEYGTDIVVFEGKAV